MDPSAPSRASSAPRYCWHARHAAQHLPVQKESGTRRTMPCDHLHDLFSLQPNGAPFFVGQTLYDHLQVEGTMELFRFHFLPLGATELRFMGLATLPSNLARLVRLPAVILEIVADSRLCKSETLFLISVQMACGPSFVKFLHLFARYFCLVLQHCCHACSRLLLKFFMKSKAFPIIFAATIIRVTNASIG